MSNNENPNPLRGNQTDLILIIIFALGVSTWICYFLSVSGVDF